MTSSTLKRSLLASAAFVAVGVIGAAAANAQGQPFTFNPNGVPGIPGGTYTVNPGPPTGLPATDIKDNTSAVITATSATTATETGWLSFASFVNGPSSYLFTSSGLVPGNTASPPANTYGMYVKFTAGSTLTAPLNTPQVDTTTSFNYTMFFDIGNNDVFNSAVAGSPGSATVTGGTSNDIPIAFGVLINGQDGFTTAAGLPVPFLNVDLSFAVCTGLDTANLGGVVLTGAAATACTTSYNAQNFFTGPIPFYSVAFGEGNVTPQDTTAGVDGGGHPDLAINPAGATVDIDFVKTPEPTSTALFGSGLLALGWLTRRRRRKAT
jgi:hypothetical protein